MICRKTKFLREQDALDWIKDHRNNKKYPKYAYKCFCGCWHLTSRKSEESWKGEIKALNDIINIQSKRIKELENLCSQETKSLEKEIQTDKRVKRLNERLGEANKTISRLRLDNSDLINKNYIVNQKIKNMTETNKETDKISWWEYQKGEKWFLWALLPIFMGVIGVIWCDGGWLWGTFMGIVAGLLIVGGGVIQWLKYKKGKNL